MCQRISFGTKSSPKLLGQTKSSLEIGKYKWKPIHLKIQTIIQYVVSLKIGEEVSNQQVPEEAELEFMEVKLEPQDEEVKDVGKEQLADLDLKPLLDDNNHMSGADLILYT